MRTSLSLAGCVLGLLVVGAGCAPQASVAPSENQPTQTQGNPSAATTTTSSTTPTKPTTTGTTTKPKTAPPATHTSTVTIGSMKFGPQILAIKAGDTVVWVNKDTVPHTTKADLGLLWDSGTIRPGGSYSRVFKAPGSYTYACGIHPEMHGTIIVK